MLGRTVKQRSHGLNIKQRGRCNRRGGRRVESSGHGSYPYARVLAAYPSQRAASYVRQIHPIDRTPENPVWRKEPASEVKPVSRLETKEKRRKEFFRNPVWQTGPQTGPRAGHSAPGSWRSSSSA